MPPTDNSRPPIPSAMAREIRQRCGFGCVICGMPLYEYEHMAEWAIVKRHSADEITLLCDQHHREKTNGLLPKSAVAEANTNPHNLKAGVSKPYLLHFTGTTAEILIGNNGFSCLDNGSSQEMVALSIDGNSIVSFVMEDGHLLLNVLLFNEFNEVVLCIQDNALVYKPIAWDIKLIGKTLSIRDGIGKIFFDIDFLPPSKVHIKRGKLLCNGVEVDIFHDGVSINGRKISGINFPNCQGGFILGTNPRRMNALIAYPNIHRYKRAVQ